MRPIDCLLPRILKYAIFTFALFVFFNKSSCGQQSVSAWHGIQREIRYRPDGGDFVINNGRRRFNRALYGTNTAFRVEAGDLPEFALYLPGMGGNLKLGLILGDKSKWLINASSIEARYRPGAMIYVIKDTLLGKGTLNIHVLAGTVTESLIVKASFTNVNPDVKLFWAYGGATGKKFSRDGDIGADPESSFYLQPDYCKNNEYLVNKNAFTLNFNSKSVNEAGRYEIDPAGTSINKGEAVTKNLIYGIFPASEDVHLADAGQQRSPLAMFNSKSNDRPAIAGIIKANLDVLYWLVQSGKAISNTNLPALFNEAEAKRVQLVSQVQVKTPDAYINTLGGALSVAADGIWEFPSYLHGAVAWRMRLNAWRGPYVADPLGWHDRAWSHFNSYALSQITTPETGPVVADTALHLARQLEKLGTALFSSGYISRNPGGEIKPHHYDMNLVYIDELLNHFKWTGDLLQVKQMWPVLKRHLAWEKRNFDADSDGLYDAYCAIWASDALQYSGGGVTHSSAYNYRSNKAAAYIAKLIGEDPKPYQQEADKILNAINKQLWMPANGSYAEYKDILGLQLLHPSAGLWTVYHAIDSEVPDAFQAYQALRYVDTQIPHIPVVANGLAGNYYLPATTNWLPYDWSLNNVAMAETMHTALAYWQSNRPEEAFVLWKSALIESMYLGASPGNFQQLSFYDAQRGELYRDFADPIGMTARTLVEGLFGIRSDMLKGELVISPGLPSDWNYASLNVPDLNFDFRRKGQVDTYHITPHFKKEANLIFKVPARFDDIISIMVNGRLSKWVALTDAVGQPVLQLNAGSQKDYVIKIAWRGKTPVTNYPVKTYSQMVLKPTWKNVNVLKLNDPQHILDDVVHPSARIGLVNKMLGYHTYFIKLKQGKFTWWQPININVVKPIEITKISQSSEGLAFKIKSNGVGRRDEIIINPGLGKTYRQVVEIADSDRSAVFNVPNKNLLPGSNHIMIKTNGDLEQLDTTIINWQIPVSFPLKTETIDLKPYFNDKVTDIFKHKYLSPRPKSPTLQLPTQGIGNWAYPLVTANIDDGGLKKAAVANNGLFTIPQHIPFATPVDDEKNIIFTSQWDNFPKEINVPLSGQAIHAYLLMAGSTNPMQSRLTNAEVIITYQDGTNTVLPIKNPENWWPIEQDDDNDGYAFNTNAVKVLRVYLKTGEVTQNFKNFISIKGYSNRAIDGGAATVLDMPLDPSKKLKALTLKTLANDVVVGLMSITLVRG
jgi:hypothetical protein